MTEQRAGADRTYLEQRWCALLQSSARPSDAARHALDELLAAYTDPSRHYHDLTHIAALLRLSDTQAALFKDRTSVDLAIFYHDAVYDTARKDNETESARLAVTRLPSLGITSRQVNRVVTLIEATAHGVSTPDPNDADLLRFLDLDLSILAAPRDAYVHYAVAIRAEYAIYPDTSYRAGRKRVLEAFLARPCIYTCDDLHALWDAPARENLRSEISIIESGQPLDAATLKTIALQPPAAPHDGSVRPRNDRAS